MATRPEVLAVRRDGDRVELDLRIPETLAFFPDHFPDCPLLPGVIQVDWAIAFARQHLDLTGDFRGLGEVKFMHPILPRVQVTLALRLGGDGLRFEYRDARRPCSNGRILFGEAA